MRWLTTTIKDYRERLQKFLSQYHKKDIEKLQKKKERGLLEIDYFEINQHFETHLKIGVLDIPNFFYLLQESEEKINKNRNKKQRINLKISEIEHNIKLRELNSEYIGEFISTSAMIKNITPINARIQVALYECRGCMRLHEIEIVSGEAMVEPSLCHECGSRSFRLLPSESKFIDYRYVKLEEPLEIRQSGITREFKAYMDNYLASPNYLLKPGDVCDVSGTFDVVRNDKDKEWEFLLKIHHIKPLNSTFEDIQLTDLDIKEIEKLSQKKDIFKSLVKSIAPSVYGHETIKEGIVLQLFEGKRPKEDVFKSNNQDRWTINILLIGDPGIAKSKLLKEVSSTAPKSINVSGTGSTQAGLTASAVKDELTGTWAMEAGAIVLADSGILTIDEFDKLSKKVQKSLNEPLEDLTVSTAKAGLVQTMTSRTSVLGSANPKFSKWDKYEPLKKQLDVPDSTLSRFDLVYIMEDKIDRENDKDLSVKVLGNDFNNVDGLIEDDLLKKYISYAKSEIHPELTPEAIETISDFYVETRQSALNNEDSKPITLREMKAIERLSIARAKLELREYVELKDANDAIRIYKNSLETLGLNPETAGVLQEVRSDKEIKIIKKATSLIKENVGLYGTRLSDDIVREIKANLKTSFKVKMSVVEECYKFAFESIKKDDK